MAYGIANTHASPLETKIIPDDGKAGDHFGNAVSVSEDYAIIGANGDDGDQGDDSGAAYIFQFDSDEAQWSQQAQLIPQDSETGDHFGAAVAISKTDAIVGTAGDDTNGSNSGAAYIFRFSPYAADKWVQQAKLTAQDGSESDHFGNAVAISGDYAIVGADLDDDNGDSSGSAYIFKWDGMQWTQQAKLTPSDGVAGDHFGRAVAISENHAVVGAYLNDDDGDGSGSAYVFRRDGETWLQQDKLTASDGGWHHFFGESVSLSGEYILVGASGNGPGAAYIFRQDDESGWLQQDKLTPCNGTDGDEFGISVSLSGNYAVVGADEDTEKGTSAGAAYIFKRSSERWLEREKLTASDAEKADFFGRAVAISVSGTGAGEKIFAIAGAYYDDDQGSASGAAYLYGDMSVTDAGDFNNDGGADLKDIILGLQIIAEIHTQNVLAADVSGDQRIGLEEVIYLLQNTSGNIWPITLTAAPATLPADGISESRIRAIGFDSNRNPIPDGEHVEFSITSGGGRLSSGTAQIRCGTASITYYAGTTGGTVIIRATMPDRGVSGSVSLLLESTEVETITLSGTVEPDSILADGKSASQITVTVRGNNARPLANIPVSFSDVTSGDASLLGVVSTNADGVAEYEYTSTTTEGGVVIRAEAKGLNQNLYITQTPAYQDTTPSVIVVEAAQDTIRPGESTQVSASVYTESGRPLSDIEVIFKLSDPTLAVITASAATSEEGVATAILTAREMSGEVRIIANAGEVSNQDNPEQIEILDTSAPSSVTLNVTPEQVLLQGTATVTAEVLDANGEPVPNGTTVTFALENDKYGELSASAATHDGIATTTFKAANYPGIAKITARSGAAFSSPLEISIEQAPAASIEFLSVDPGRIAIRGTGGTETAIIRFTVKNSNGDVLEGIPVSLEMDGPNGGEYINSSGSGALNEMEVSSDAQGVAQIILHSGIVTGPVTILASIETETGQISARSSVVSIGGGVPSARRLEVTSEWLNLPGLVYKNEETNLSVYLADRFGNYNMLKGTTISFASEGGLAVGTNSVTLDETGQASVIARTQGIPEDVSPQSWEEDLQSYVSHTYGYGTDGHPRDGVCSVLVYTKGEEHFDDLNANGVFDEGETFLDTPDDPFCDYNDNSVYDDLAEGDPKELFIDAAPEPDGKWTKENGKWDESKYIFENLPILITGPPVIRSNLDSFNVGQGGEQDIKILICDQNLNSLTPGSEFSIETDVGKVIGETKRVYDDHSTLCPSVTDQLERIEFEIQIYDDESDDEDPPKRGTIAVTVSWKGNDPENMDDTTLIIPGMVD